MKKNEDAAAKKKPKTSAAQIRVQKGASSVCLKERWWTDMLHTDLTELDLPSTMKTHFPDPNDLLNFTLTITPDEGMWPCIAGDLIVMFCCSPLRHVPGWRVPILVPDQQQLPSRATKSQVC